MQGEDDLRGLAKIMAFMRTVSIIVMIMHLYWFCYGFFDERQWTIDIATKILHNFNRTAGLFSQPLYTKIFAVLLLGLSCLGTKGIKNENITWNKINVTLVTGFLLFFLNGWLLKVNILLAVHLYFFRLDWGIFC